MQNQKARRDHPDSIEVTSEASKRTSFKAAKRNFESQLSHNTQTATRPQLSAIRAQSRSEARQPARVVWSQKESCTGSVKRFDVSCSQQVIPGTAEEPSIES